MIDRKAENRSAAVIKYTKRVLVYAFLGLCALAILFPFYIAVITSFKPFTEANNVEFTWWPKHFTLHGYADVFTYTGGTTVNSPLVLLGFFNTLWMVLPRTIVGTLVSGMAAFAYAKLNFRVKKISFNLLLLTMMVPGVIMLIPSYMLYYWYGWLNTPLPVIIPSLLGGTSAIFFIRQYYLGVPNDMMEAAQLDGLGYFGTYFYIMLPIAMPAFWAQFIIGFISGYNEYLGPMLYLKEASLLTLQLALQQFSSSRGNTDPGAVMSAALVALVPTITLFVIAQKQFISGIVTSGLKL